jgi:hypothetical protein
MSIVIFTLHLTCKFIDLEKYSLKRQIVKPMKKVNGVIYLRTEVVEFCSACLISTSSTVFVIR